MNPASPRVKITRRRPAFRKGKCPSCGGPIFVGETIAPIEENRWVHDSCAEDEGYTVLDLDEEHAAEPDQAEPEAEAPTPLFQATPLGSLDFAENKLNLDKHDWGFTLGLEVEGGRGVKASLTTPATAGELSLLHQFLGELLGHTGKKAA